MENKKQNRLNLFQNELYEHLINYKTKILKITSSGSFKGKTYSIILPEKDVNKNLITEYQQEINVYIKEKSIRKHIFFNHLASSQVACFNLFFPLKKNKELANFVFSILLPEFNELIDIEFEYYNRENDYLNEKRNNRNNVANVGTDSDIAIFYLNKNNEKILCLIEHKLSENNFTYCNAVKSKNNTDKQVCNKFDFNKTDTCYYQIGKGYNYWKITKDSNSFFDLEKLQKVNELCPFKTSLQQLWRNMLLASAIENDKDNEIKRAYFGVVFHENNMDLWKINGNMQYKRADDFFKSFLKDKDKFFTITLQKIVERINLYDKNVDWLSDYCDKYKITK